MKKSHYIIFILVIINPIISLLTLFINGSLSISFPIHSSSLFAQNVGINNTGANPHSSALLDIDDSPKNNTGLLIPRISLQSLNTAAPVNSPATSLLVFNIVSAGTGSNSVTPGYYFWDGIQWQRFATGGASAGSWLLPGNTGTSPGVDFIGTTDGLDFAVKTNAIEKWRILSGSIPEMKANSNDMIFMKTGTLGFTDIGGNSATVGLMIGRSNSNTNLTDYYSVQMGNGNTSASSSSLSLLIGNSNNHFFNDTNCVSIGFGNSMNSATNSFNLGYQTNGSSSSNFFNIGYSNNGPKGTNSFNIGHSTNSGPGNNCFSIANNTNGFSGANCFYMGYSQNGQSGSNSFYIGNNHNGCSGTNSFCFGNSAYTGSTDNFAIGTANYNFASDGFIIANNTYIFNPKTIIFGGTGTDALNVGIGLISPAFVLDVAGTTRCTGNVWTSDVRKKHFIEPLTFNALELVKSLNPVSFGWKQSLDIGMNGTQMGFIAQEIEKLIPSMVVANNDEKTLGVKYNELYPILIKALQEQQIQIENNQLLNNNIKKEIAALRLK